jgi:hypothetical protein
MRFSVLGAVESRLKMLDLLLYYRTLIATVFGAVVGLAVLIYYPSLGFQPTHCAVLWAVFLGFLELPRNRP